MKAKASTSHENEKIFDGNWDQKIPPKSNCYYRIDIDPHVLLWKMEILPNDNMVKR